MLWTIAAILIILWVLGLSTYTMGGLLHMLLVIAIVFVLVNMIQERRTMHLERAPLQGDTRKEENSEN